MVYTLVIGMIIMTIAVYGFSLEEKRQVNIELENRQLSGDLYNYETNSYLLKCMTTYITSKVSIVNSDSVMEFLNSKSSLKIGNENYYIAYSNLNSKFVLCQPYGNGKYKIDEYYYKVAGSEIDYIYCDTRYMWGYNKHGVF